MEWIKVEDTSVEIPFTKVCIYDGANTFWAYLEKIEITGASRKLTWEILTPDNYSKSEPTHWMSIEHPKSK